MIFKTIKYRGRFVDANKLSIGIHNVVIPELFSEQTSLPEIARLKKLTRIDYLLKCRLHKYQIIDIESEKKEYGISDILVNICNYYDIDINSVNTSFRFGELVKVRKYYSYFAKELTTSSLSVIGGLINRGHCNVLHHHSDVIDKIRNNNKISVEIRNLRNYLNEKHEFKT